jgi:predicted nucleotidyltransferase
MAYSKDEVITLIRAFIADLHKDFPIERAYLFGSYATGRNKDYSDIDLALISPAINSSNSFTLNKTIFHRAMRFNVDLEPICFSPEEFTAEQLPIIRDIKRSGIEIAVSTQ